MLKIRFTSVSDYEQGRALLAKVEEDARRPFEKVKEPA
jgi:hypothetical protein